MLLRPITGVKLTFSQRCKAKYQYNQSHELINQGIRPIRCVLVK